MIARTQCKMPKRGESRKYALAREALAKLIAIGNDRNSFGKPLMAARVKSLDPSFQKVPQSTWRRIVREERAKAALSAPQNGKFFFLCH